MIETRKLTKRYGDLVAVDAIDLRLEPGDVFGFIGPNGSGKTTTMRMIATLLPPDHGEAYVCGESIYTKPREIRRLVGYMPDLFGVYEDMTVLEYLEFFAAAYHIDASARRKVAEEKLELVDMAFKRDAMVNELSRGQTQRVGLARTLLHEPQVLLLDEPASGLDPRARIEIRNLLRRLGEMKKTVIVSSHILPELADVCTRVGMIEKGELLVDGDVREVMRKAREAVTLEIRVRESEQGTANGEQRTGASGGRESSGGSSGGAPDGPPTGGLTPTARLSTSTTSAEAAARLLEECDETSLVTVAPDGLITAVLHKHVEDYADLPQRLWEAGHRITQFREEEVNLETAFMELTKGKQQ
ncbi:MAG: ABC transporter ATP-binding protein [Planctomycetota bacterium]